MTEILCGIMLVVFFVVMIGVGFYSRKHATNVSGFVLGGRSAGPWLTAFAFGTSYFSAVIFVGYAGQFDGAQADFCRTVCRLCQRHAFRPPFTGVFGNISVDRWPGFQAPGGVPEHPFEAVRPQECGRHG